MTRETTVPELFNQAEYLVDRHVQEGRGENVAIYFRDSRITYAELAFMVNKTGNALKNLGVEMENRVMLVLHDCPEFVYTYVGAMKIGAVPVPVNTLASSPDYRHFLNNSRAKVLVTSPELLEKIKPVMDDLKYLKHIILVGGEADRMLKFDEAVSGASDVLEAAETSKDDVSFWMYTSGTTGFPKGVVHLHHDIMYYMPPVCDQVIEMTQNDIIFSTSKMFFSYGRNNSLETALMYGASAVLYPEWPDPGKLMQIVEQYRPTLFFSVPTFYAALLREAGKADAAYDLSSVRRCLSAGEALPKGIYEQWYDMFGLQILDIIGSTDVGGEYMGNRKDDLKPGSTGKLLDGFEGELRNSEGNVVEYGQVGTLWLKNDGVAACYWNKHERTKQVFVGNWFNTGDQFYQDEDGFYWYQGREDDMLKVSGQWVSYMEIERVLEEHPSVRESAVVGSPDAAGLIRIKAFVIPVDEYQTSPELEKELIDFVRDRIAHFKAPRWVEFIDEMPRTATGKLQRHKLR